MSKRICVVGAGRWGKNHIRTLNELGYLAGIVEASPDTRAEFQEKYPDIQIFASVRDAIKEEFDGFTVATPAETHFEIAKFIIEHKRHLLVEKPITTRLADAQQLKRLTEENGVNLMTGHLLLFHPAIRKIKELIDGGKIGKFEYIYSNRLNLGTVRTEENILWSFAPHDISIFQYFIGRFPIEIVSRGGAFLQPHIHDSSMTVLIYPNNIVGHIFVNWLHPFKEHRLVVVGSKGMLSYEDSSEDKSLRFYEKGIDWIQGEPIKRDGPTEVIPFDAAMPLTEELKYFVSHTDGGPVEIANAQNAVEVLEILERATESLLSGGSQRTEVGSQTTEDQGFFAHHSVEIDEGCEIGDHTKIWHFSHILSGSRIGERCNIGQNVVIGPEVTIGNQCKIQNNVSVYKGVTLEDGVFCGPSMVFTNVYNPRAEIRKMDQVRPTLVKHGATLGANCTIVCGTTIGRYAFIGAGAVVTHNAPDHALMLGNPATRAGWMCQCGERLTDNLECLACGKSYTKEEEGLKETKT
ncbi:MAG: Gfo/Idh/MocA family oxidoreductase [Deltaproteobacteria bacterium]|nr:Gfo/Idh/MocA family oxidoreductase [Deltaproteobacteria bacterium]MBW2354516.1 Gfo/Idh/MocA family oxidoreductase [Deltaproteobacteria bacterium]